MYTARMFKVTKDNSRPDRYCVYVDHAFFGYVDTMVDHCLIDPAGMSASVEAFRLEKPLYLRSARHRKWLEDYVRSSMSRIRMGLPPPPHTPYIKAGQPRKEPTAVISLRVKVSKLDLIRPILKQVIADLDG